ncbi:MAG: T9SS type A sorting domain-containing protein [Saprospiraceae bacterium]
MKTIQLSILLCSLLLLPIFSFTQARTYLAIESKEVQPEAAFCLDLSMAKADRLLSVSWEMHWDPAVLAHTGMNDFFLFNPSINQSQISNGKITVDWSATPNNALILDEPQRLFTVCFNALATEETNTVISLKNIELKRSNEIDVPYTFAESKIAIRTNPNPDDIITILDQLSEPNCFFDEVGTIEVVPFFGQRPLTYEWNGGSIEENNETTIRGLATGNYQLNLTDANGVTATKTYSIIGSGIADLAERAEVGGDCGLGGNISLALNDAIPPLTYAWSNGSNAPSLTQVDPGAYQVTVTDANNCQAMGQFEVIDLPQHLDTIRFTPPLCDIDESANITLYPNFFGSRLSYNWNTGSTFSSLINLGVGNYSVTITDETGCSTVEEINLEVVQPTVTAKNLVCATPDLADGEARVFYSPVATTYRTYWEDGSTSGGSVALNADLSVGTHYFTVGNIVGCEFFTDSIVMQAGLADVRETYYSCKLDSIALLADGGQNDFTYAWSPPEDFVDPTASSAIYVVPAVNPNDSLPNAPLNITLTSTATGGCEQIFRLKVLPQADCVWPGDTDANQKVDPLDLLHIALTNGETGVARNLPSTEWFAQASTRWGANIPDTELDLMHADANGDGMISDADTVVVIENLGQTHLGFAPDLTEVRNGNVPLEIILPAVVSAGERSIFPIHLGEANVDINNAYGLYFQIHYPTDAVILDEAAVKNNGWLAEENAAWTFNFLNKNAGVLEVVLTRFDQMGQSGSGKIADLIMEFLALENTQSIDLSIENAYLIGRDGAAIEVAGITSTSVLQGTTTATNNSIEDANLILFPNPSKNFLQIESPLAIDGYAIYNLTGELLKSIPLEETKIWVGDLPKGGYVIVFRQEGKRIFRRFVKF